MEVRWLPFAKDQLKVVVQYVLDEFGENTARKSLQKILNKVGGLSAFPDIGVLDRKFSANGIKVRHLNIGPNIVFYIVDMNDVIVIAVMHNRQSPETINRTIRHVLDSNY